MITKQNKIIITHNYEHIINYYKNHFNGDVFIYEDDELLIDTSRQIIQKAYLSNEKDMLFILAYKSYKIEAQNALLKIFEESPTGVSFIILSPSKNILLPTIRSRFIIDKYNDKKEDFELAFSLDNFDYEKFYKLINTYSFLEKNEMIELLKAISKKYADKICLKDLESLFNLFELAKLNTKNELILSCIGFIFLRNKIWDFIT